MDFREKSLYHQIHPVKLITDISTGLAAIILLWFHFFWTALITGIIPPIFVSGLLIQYSDLEKYKTSARGKYLAKHMGRIEETLRLFGYVVMAVGAWIHSISLILLGVGTILFGWFKGKIFSKRNPPQGSG